MSFQLSLLLLMTLCHISSVLPFSGVLIFISPPISFLRSIICFSKFLVILSDPSLTCTPFLLSEVQFLYALVTDAPMSFPTLFIRSLVEVYRSSSTAHGLFFPVFIHRILLHLGLEDFPASEPIHIIALIGATFLRQKVAQMKAGSKSPRVESSTGAAAQPPSSGNPIAKAYVDPTVAVDPQPLSLCDSSIQNMLDTVITVQATHG